MPYSAKKNAIFVWIPKTAGTSIANKFGKRKIFSHNGKEDLWGRIPEEEREKRQASNWQHISALSIIDELGQVIWDECFTFTIVRNPYDRLVSFYEYSRLSRKNPSSVQYGLPDPGNFEKWLNTEKPLGQLHYITDRENNILVDYVGRMESLQKDIVKICLKLKILPFKLPRLNVSKRNSYQSYYSPEIKKQVDAMYHDEIEALSYEF